MFENEISGKIIEIEGLRQQQCIIPRYVCHMKPVILSRLSKMDFFCSAKKKILFKKY